MESRTFLNKCKHKKRKKSVRRRTRIKKKKSKKTNQKGKGMFSALQNTRTIVKKAAQVAKHSKPNSPFRLAAQTRFGLPSSLQRKMYKYH